MTSSFTDAQLSRAVPLGLVWLTSTVAECRGRQSRVERERPELLETLRQAAIIQSAESSNRIEGVTVDRDRLAPLVVGSARPRDRPEEEIVGYRRALQWIHTKHERIAMSPDTLLELHAKAQRGAGDAGQWKRVATDVIEKLPDGTSRLRFRTVSVAETPARVAALVAAYRRAMTENLLPPLLAEASLVLDFLCIHPFRDGNGRVARLLSLLVTYQHGFTVGRFISLERVIEETKEEYYDSLYRSSQGWHEATHDVVPWWSYFLSVMRQAFRELDDRIARAPRDAGGKSALVLAAVEELPPEFTIADVSAACPSVSEDLIRQVLRSLRDQGRLETRRGRGASWRKRTKRR